MRTKVKMTLTIDTGLIGEIDRLVENDVFESRSAAMEAAMSKLLDAQADAQFERALDALTPEDVKEMQAMAEEGMADYAQKLAEYPW